MFHVKHWTPPQDNPTRPGFAVKIVRRAIVPGNSVPHVDYIDPAGVIPFVTALGDTRVDIMLESRM